MVKNDQLFVCSGVGLHVACSHGCCDTALGAEEKNHEGLFFLISVIKAFYLFMTDFTEISLWFVFCCVHSLLL